MNERTSRKRLTGIDFVRVAAMLSVIWIHVSAPFLNHTSGLTLFHLNPAFYLNQVTRFSVPMFFLLSGFSLGMGKKTTGYLKFQKRRLPKILVPYVIWTVIYDLYNHQFVLHEWFADGDCFGRVIRGLYTGYTTPHLYFILILLQFYLLYPLLKPMVIRRPVLCSLASFLLCFVLQMSGALNLSWMVQLQSRIPIATSFAFWLFYFVFGMSLQKLDYGKMTGICRKCAGILIPACLLVLLLDCLLASKIEMLGADRPTMLLIVPLVFFFGLSVWEIIECGMLERIVAFLSEQSMDIYFSHVLILCYLRLIPRTCLGMSGMMMLYGLTLIASIPAAWCIGMIRSVLKKICSRISSGMKS